MRRRTRTHGDQAVDWIEQFCTERGNYVKLTTQEIIQIRMVYDNPDPPAASIEPIAGRLAAFIALLHTCGVEHSSEPPPLETPDIFSLWNACGPQLREVLRREGSTLICPALGKSFPGRAA